MTGLRRVTILGAAIVAIGAGCAEFAPVNPYDSRYAVRMEITGPDSTASLGDTVTFQLATTPAWTGSAPVWSSTGRSLQSLGGGRFKVVAPRGSDSVWVNIGPHRMSRPVYVRQVPVALGITAGNGIPLHELTLTAYLDTVGNATPIEIDEWDARGIGIDQGFYIRSVWVPRDTQVLRVSNGSAIAYRDGSTWLIADAAALRDSVLVHVRQDPVWVACQESVLLNLPLNDSLQMLTAQWYDHNNQPVDSVPPIVQWSFVLGNPTFLPGQSLEVTSSGMIHTNAHANNGFALASWKSLDGEHSGVARPGLGHSCNISSG